MEPEIIALARRMSDAGDEQWKRDHPDRVGPQSWETRLFAHRRCMLAIAVMTRPDLAEGVRVEAGHWAAGILQTREAP